MPEESTTTISDAHLGTAYQVVAAIRHQLKISNINYDWTNIVRIMNSQKMSTIKMFTKTKEVHIRKMSISEDPVKIIYAAMGITTFPEQTRNNVV